MDEAPTSLHHCPIYNGILLIKWDAREARVILVGLSCSVSDHCVDAGKVVLFLWFLNRSVRTLDGKRSRKVVGLRANMHEEVKFHAISTTYLIGVIPECCEKVPQTVFVSRSVCK